MLRIAAFKQSSVWGALKMTRARHPAGMRVLPDLRSKNGSLCSQMFSIRFCWHGSAGEQTEKRRIYGRDVAQRVKPMTLSGPTMRREGSAKGLALLGPGGRRPGGSSLPRAAPLGGSVSAAAPPRSARAGPARLLPPAEPRCPL